MADYTISFDRRQRKALIRGLSALLARTPEEIAIVLRHSFTNAEINDLIVQLANLSCETDESEE